MLHNFLKTYKPIEDKYKITTAVYIVGKSTKNEKQRGKS